MGRKLSNYSLTPGSTEIPSKVVYEKRWIFFFGETTYMIIDKHDTESYFSLLWECYGSCLVSRKLKQQKQKQLI